MSEINNSPEPLSIFENLSEDERLACVNLAYCVWSEGSDQDFVDGVGIDKKLMKELIERGIAEKRTTWEIHQELANSLKEKVKEIRRKLHEDAIPSTNEEREILMEYERHKNFAEEKSGVPRYRLKNENLHNFIRKELNLD